MRPSVTGDDDHHGFRTRPRRRPSTYYGEDSDSEEASRPIRNRNQPNYAVDTSSEDEAAASSDSDIQVIEPPSRQPPPRRIPTRSVKRKGQSGISKRFETVKRRKVLGAPLKQNHGPKPEDTPFVRSGGKVPPWQNLEHGILTEIFKKAAYPLYEDYVRVRVSVKWLVGVSYLSKSFHDAALSALLFFPPLVPNNGRDLVDLLSRDQDHMSTNYRVKPRMLVVEAKHLLVNKGSKISLPELVSMTPLLESLRIVSRLDMLSTTWAQASAAKKTYIYEAKLFETLEESCPRLNEFEWNGRFATGLADLIDTVTSVHEKFPLFNGLKSIKLMNFSVPEKITDEAYSSFQRRLLAALSSIPKLVQLNINNCDVLGNFALLASMCSSELRRVTITECHSLTGEGLATFLAAKGSQLRELRLAGCQSCDGSFLADLREYCPRLEVLYLDLSFRDVSSFHDVEPRWNDFLPNGCITYPSTLVDLHINNLRKVDASQINESLESLIRTDLPQLRRLSMKVMVENADYRERARIRNEWRDKLEQVFLRRCAPPLSSSHIRVTLPVRRNDGTIGSSATSTSDEAKKRQSSRISKPSHREATSITSQDTNLYNASAPRAGLCEVVEFRVDDQRPAESQYAEADFLDDELSGDEDYND